MENGNWKMENRKPKIETRESMVDAGIRVRFRPCNLSPPPWPLLPTSRRWSLLPIPYTLLPTPWSLFPTAYSLLPIPHSPLPI
jgi:hypothetical protein